MSSVAKGNSLEDALVKYLKDEQKRGDLVYGVHNANLCKIRKKAKYPCPGRQKPVEFDVVIEVYRQGATTPHSYLVFECKNYRSAIPEYRVRAFSDQLRTVFENSAKGVLVISSRLQSGAETTALSRHMGIAKFSETGLEVLAERSDRHHVESAFVRSQIFAGEPRVKSLKFSACFDGRFFSSIGQLLRSFEPEATERTPRPLINGSAPFVSLDDIRMFATEIVEGTGYKAGPVDLVKVCAAMSLELKFTRRRVYDEDGTLILGSANFDRNLIEVHLHDNQFRERFTIGHEVGHFCLGHGVYLRSETVIERDLLTDVEGAPSFNIARLEAQANLFASELILPDKIFRVAVDVGCERLNMKDIGFGRIFVDDNPWTYQPYNDLISELSQYFRVSKQAAEIRLKKLGLVNDQRRFGKTSSAIQLGEIFARLDTHGPN